MKAKTSKVALLVMISISFVLLASLGAAVHAATRAGDKYIIDENLFPDPAFRQYVLDTIDENGSGALEDFEREKVTTIDLKNGYNGTKIYDLTGLEYFENIEYLYVSNNHLEKLPSGNFSSLRGLECENNHLLCVDKSNFPTLHGWFCNLSPQTRTLLVTSETIDLQELDSSIQENQIENLSGADLNGTILSILREYRLTINIR